MNRCQFCIINIILILLCVKGDILAFAACYEIQDAEMVIGTSDGAMTPKATRASYGAEVVETALGNFVADAFRIQGGADIAMVPGSHLIESLPGGEILKGDVYDVFKDNLEIGMFKLTEAQLFGLMDFSVQHSTIDETEKLDPNASSDMFLQISGFTLTYDASQPPFEKINSIQLDDGRNLDATGKSVLSIVAPVDLIERVKDAGIIDYIDYIVIGNESELVIDYITSISGTVKRPGIERINITGTRDNTLFSQLKGVVFLPYIILLFLLFSLPGRKYRLRNIDGSLTKRFRHLR